MTRKASHSRRAVLALAHRLCSPGRFVMLFFVFHLAASGRLYGQRHLTTFGAIRDLAANRTAQGLLAGDFNGDGLTDIAAYGGTTVVVYYQPSAGGEWTSSSLRLDRPVRRAVAARCNADRIDDIALLTEPPGEVRVLLGRTRKGLAAAWRRSIEDPISHLLVAPLNGDRHADLLLWGEKRLGVDILLGSSGGSFRPAETLLSEFSSSALAIDDMNDDGVGDLIAADWVSNVLRIETGFGQLRFSDPTELPLDYEPTFVATAFMNRDAIKDIVVASAANRTCQIFYGDGLGGYTPSGPIPLGVPPSSIDLADVNGDGALDIGVMSAAGRTLLVGLNDGEGMVQELLRFSGGRAPTAFAFVPHAKTRRTDAAILDTASHRIRLALHASLDDSTTLTVNDYLTGLAPASIALGGTAKNRSEDVYVANANSRTVSLFRGRPGGGLMGQMSFSTVTRPTLLTQVWRNDTMTVLLTSDPQDRSSSVVEVHTDDYSHRSYPLPLRDESELLSVTADAVSGNLTILALEPEPRRSRSSLIEFEQIAPSRFIERTCTPTLPWPLSAFASARRASRSARDLCFVRYNPRTKAQDVYRSSADRTRQFAPPVLEFSLSVPESVGVKAWAADLNGDGNDDLILNLLEPANALVWSLRMKDSAFAPPAGRMAGIAIQGQQDLQVVDVNGDNIPDILFEDNLTRSLYYLPGNGGGSFLPRIRLVSTEGMGGFAFRRRRADAQPQLLVSDQVQGILRVIPLGEGEE